MALNTFRYRLPEFYGHRISYVLCHIPNAVFFFILRKTVIGREGLNECGFARRNSPVLFRMPISPVSYPETHGRKRRSRFVPSHSGVYAMLISIPGRFLVAFGNKVIRRSLGKISSVLRNPFHPFLIEIAHLLRPMVRVGRMTFSDSYLR